MSTQGHHLIPDNVADSHALFEALSKVNHQYSRFVLDLPDKATAAAAAAASQAGDVADSAHTGRHYGAYDRLVRAYLSEFQVKYTERDPNGGFRLKAGVDIDDVFKSLKSLDVRLADWHTAGVDANGKITSPAVILNGSDPRIGTGPGKISAQEAIDRLDRLAANAGADINSNTGEFGNLWKMHAGLGDLNVDAGNRSGLDIFQRKMRLAASAGLTELNGVNVQRYLGGAKAMARLLASDDFKKLQAAIANFAGNEQGFFSPDAAGQALKKMSDKAGKLELIAMGIVGISLYQIASKYDVDVAALIAELDLKLSPEMIADFATGIIKIAFEAAVLTFATGGVGTVLTLAVLARDAKDSLETLKLALDLYKIAFPDGVLGDIIEGVLPAALGKGESFAKAHINNAGLLEFIGVDFKQFNKAQGIVVADDLEGDEANQGKLIAKGTNPNSFVPGGPAENGSVRYIPVDGTDILWGRNGAKVYGLGGSDLVFHTGYGEAHGGDGNDVVISQEGRFVKKGEAFNLKAWAEYEVARLLNFTNVVLGIPEVPLPPKPAVAFKDYKLTLDGGAGNDAVLALGEGKEPGQNQNVITIGGDGRDWIYNTSTGGELFGDTVDGLDSLRRVVYEEKWAGKAAAGEAGGAPRDLIYCARRKGCPRCILTRSCPTWCTRHRRMRTAGLTC